MSLFSEFPGLKRVPDFVGLDFDGARALELASGRGFRDPDPDAPPITNRWWADTRLVVAGQTPPAGSPLPRDERVCITLEEPQDRTAARVVARTPPSLEGHAPAD